MGKIEQRNIEREKERESRYLLTLHLLLEIALAEKGLLFYQHPLRDATVKTSSRIRFPWLRKS